MNKNETMQLEKDRLILRKLIEAKYNAENIASGKLLQKVGMKQDGVLRDRRLDKETGKKNNLVICSILKSEYYKKCYL